MKAKVDVFRAVVCLLVTLTETTALNTSTLVSIREPEAAAAVQKVLLMMDKMLPETC
jgi:hypothetical protein